MQYGCSKLAVSFGSFESLRDSLWHVLSAYLLPFIILSFFHSPSFQTLPAVLSLPFPLPSHPHIKKPSFDNPHPFIHPSLMLPSKPTPTTQPNTINDHPKWTPTGVQLAGGLEKILDVGLNFKNCICPAHPRLDLELEKLRSLCEAYVKSIKRDHKKIDI